MCCIWKKKKINFQCTYTCIYTDDTKTVNLESLLYDYGSCCSNSDQHIKVEALAMDTWIVITNLFRKHKIHYLNRQHTRIWDGQDNHKPTREKIVSIISSENTLNVLSIGHSARSALKKMDGIKHPFVLTNFWVSFCSQF